MKATGIVRRIDDLGRVVIPKEIRRTFHIKEGDSLEIYTDKDGEVIFKKYSPMGELSDFSGQICDSLHKTTGRSVAICVTAAGSARRSVTDKRISPQLEEIMASRGLFTAQDGTTTPVCPDNETPYVSVCAPIIASGDVMGCVLFISEPNDPPCGETEIKLAQTVASFLGRQMEE